MPTDCLEGEAASSSVAWAWGCFAAPANQKHGPCLATCANFAREPGASGSMMGGRQRHWLGACRAGAGAANVRIVS